MSIQLLPKYIAPEKGAPIEVEADTPHDGREYTFMLILSNYDG